MLSVVNPLSAKHVRTLTGPPEHPYYT